MPRMGSSWPKHAGLDARVFLPLARRILPPPFPPAEEAIVARPKKKTDQVEEVKSMDVEQAKRHIRETQEWLVAVCAA